MNLELLAFNELEEEVFIPFTFDIQFINGFYVDAVDDDIVNLISYGEVYSVKKTHALMSQLNYKLT